MFEAERINKNIARGPKIALRNPKIALRNPPKYQRENRKSVSNRGGAGERSPPGKCSPKIHGESDS